MLSASVQKDIGEYREKVAGNLSWRMIATLGSSVALALVEGLVCYFVFGLSPNDVSMLLAGTVIAGFVIGFWRPLEMPFEKAVPLMVRQKLGKSKLTYSSSVTLPEFDEDGERKPEKKKKEVLAPDDLRKAKLYRKSRNWRGWRSAEYILPRYYAAEHPSSALGGWPAAADAAEPQGA